MIRRPPRSTRVRSSAASDVYKRQHYHIADPQPDPSGVPGYKNLYRRDNETDSFTALTTVKPATSVPASSNAVEPDAYIPVLGGFSQDGKHSVFAANDRLLAGASTATDGEGRPVFQ